MVPEHLAQRYRAEELWVDRSLGEWVELSIARNGANPFRVFSEQRPFDGTCNDVDLMARKLAAALRQRGVGVGDVVMMQLPNWAEAAATFWAAAYLGAVIVPVVHTYGPKEIEYIVGAITPDVIVTPERFRKIDYVSTYEPLLARLPDTEWLVIGSTPERRPARATAFEDVLDIEPITGPAPADPSDPVVIAFTSGTTRDPKGVIHSHLTLMGEVLQAGTTVIDERTDAGPPRGPFSLTGQPIGHYGGMLNAFLRPLLVNTAIHLIDVWNPAEVLRLMLAEDLVVVGGATFFLTSLLDHPDFTPAHLARIPAAGLGGSPVPVAVTRRATDLGIRVFRAYGSTEHPSSTSSSFEAPEIKRLTTDGRPLRGVDLRLDDDGVISTRGPELFLGYTDPSLTEAAFDDEGWFRSGDVGILDDDGYLTITDRISDVIIRGGENISAQEVEELMLTLDGIAEVAVVAAPDERFGECVAAVFTTRHDAPVPTLDEIRAHLGGLGLGRQKWPEAVHHIREFPRTASGKVQKYRLRAELRDATTLEEWR